MEQHYSVMAAEALSLLNVRPDGAYLDATAGLGGHTARIAAQLTTGTVIANDRDPQSLELARNNTARWSARIRFRYGRFDSLAEAVAEAGLEKVDGILADLGVSRYQLTDPGRGFSFMADGPLDMRMDPTTGTTAADLVNYTDEKNTRRSDIQARRREEGAESSQSNRPGTSHTEHTSSGRCGVAGRAPDESYPSCHKNIYGVADGGQR